MSHCLTPLESGRSGALECGQADTEFWIALTLLMSAFLIMGLIRRERQGPGGIGAESLAILGLYVMGVALLLGG